MKKCLNAMFVVRSSVKCALKTIKKSVGNMNDRPKGHALMLALALGLSPKSLIALGYPRATVYRWNHNYRLAIKALRGDLESRISSLSQIRKKEQIP